MKRIIFTLFIAIFCISLKSQTPGSFSYQAIVRNGTGGAIADQSVSYRFTILFGSTSGSVVYIEKHNVTTNQFGMVTLAVGNGTDKTGDISTINWGAGTYFLKVEIDAAGGTSYVDMGTTQLLSVPYALHAKTAESITGGATIAPPTATVQAASNIQSFSATLNGVVNGKGFSTEVEFEYGLTTAYTSWAYSNPNPVTGGSDVAVSAELTGLQSATLYHFRIIASNAINKIYSGDLTFTTAPSSPILTTGAVSSITGTSASGGGDISHDGGSPVTARGVCYGTAPEPSLSNSYTTNGSGTGAFTSNISGLTPGTIYYVRAYATNGIGTAYGNELNFKTATVPTVTTSAATAVNGTTAKAGGTITNDGGSTVTVSGLCWSTSPIPTTANSFNTSFTADMTGLIPGTVYYVRAYATNIAGTGYGIQISFNSGQVIGSMYAGGLVFYNDGNGHGLVCADVDQSNGTAWGCGAPSPGLLIGTTLPGLNTGAANTAAIVALCTTPGIAAQLCQDLVLNTFSDWYLPSKDELYLMYSNLYTKSLGGFVINGYYWSSTEIGSEYAWIQRFAVGGLQANISKTTTNNVRAARSF
jgi:hypothetical protein